GQGVFQEAFQGDFAEGAAGLGATENVFERASGLKHLLAGLLDFAELVLDLIDLLAGIFKLQGHRGLGFRGDWAESFTPSLRAVVTASRRVATVPAMDSSLVVLCAWVVERFSRSRR